MAGVFGTFSLCSRFEAHTKFLLSRCIAPPENLDRIGSVLRSCEHTATCIDAFDYKELWDKYGIISDVQVCYLLALPTAALNSSP